MKLVKFVIDSQVGSLPPVTGPVVIDVSDGKLDVFKAFPMSEFERFDGAMRSCYGYDHRYEIRAVFDDGFEGVVLSYDESSLGHEYDSCAYHYLIKIMTRYMERHKEYLNDQS